jgi:CheY-like chemotaxis protein
MSEATLKEMLLVEDDPAGVYLIRRAVEDCSKEIRLWFAGDGLEALAFLRKEPPFEHVPSPALILSDFHLPKLDGVEVVRVLRRMPEYKDTPAIIFSGAERAFAEERCLQAGATEYVQKPSGLYDLFAAIKAIVDTWLTHDSIR